MDTTKLKGGTIEMGRNNDVAKISVKYKKQTLVFKWPAKKSGDYKKVMSLLEKDKLQMPSTAQTVILLDFALKNKDNWVCKDILSKIKRHRLWTCTETMYTQYGVHFYENPSGEIDAEAPEDLPKGSTRFIEYGFETGWVDGSDFVNNSYILAQVGNDRDIAKMAGDIAKSFKSKPQIAEYATTRKCVKMKTTLGSVLLGDWLRVNFNALGVSDCSAFGIVK